MKENINSTDHTILDKHDVSSNSSDHNLSNNKNALNLKRKRELSIDNTDILLPYKKEYENIIKNLRSDFSAYFEKHNICEHHEAGQYHSDISQEVIIIQSVLNTIPLEQKYLKYSYFQWCFIVNKNNLCVNNTTSNSTTSLLKYSYTLQDIQNVLIIQRFYRKKMAFKICKTLYDRDAEYFVPFKNLSCTSDLHTRILNASNNAHFITQIQHKTNLSSVKSMLASSASGKELLMYGALNILNKKLEYIPNALGKDDITNGDTNMICFGLKQGEVDGLCDGDITIIIDFEKFKLLNKGSSISVKDHDFAFCDGNILFFDHINGACTKDIYNTEMTFTFEIGSMSFKIVRNNRNICFNIDKEKIFIEITNDTSICYNTSQIEQFLALQFFRFIENNNFSVQVKKQIYQELSSMNDQQLETCISKIAEGLSKRAEINVHGAATINDYCIVKITLDIDEYNNDTTTQDITLSGLISNNEALLQL